MQDSCLPNCGSCSGDQYYCGSDAFWQSCTPFPVKLGDWEGKYGDACKSNFLDFYSGGGWTSKAWYDFSQDDNSETKNYWVFHGCDGAGLQTGDCAGDTYYVEQIFNECNVAWGQDGCSCQGGYTDYSGYGRNVDHNKCPFIRPGSHTMYKSYNCGWFSTDGGWSDQGKNWFASMRQYMTNNGETGGAHTMMVYPWVCTYDETTDFSWYFAGELYGSNNIKCWCDNEPEWGGHDSTQPPKEMYAYFMGACPGEDNCIEATCALVYGCGGLAEGQKFKIYGTGAVPW